MSGRRPGMTLIEAAVTTAIVVIVAVPASRLFVAAAEASAATARQTKALVVAQLVLESRVRVVPYAQQQAATGHEAEGDLNWTLTLTPVTAKLRKAEVTVSAAGGGPPLIRLQLRLGG